MKMGFFWHIHHDVLLEWSPDIDKRIIYIRTYKPEDERAIRLRLLKKVRGSLPQAIVEGRAEYTRTLVEWDRIYLAWKHAVREMRHTDAARASTDEAMARADAMYTRACTEWLHTRTVHSAAILTLHAIECPGCPWDGKTIFPGKAQIGAL